MCQIKIPKSCWLCDEQKRKNNRRYHGWKKCFKKIEILMMESRIRYQFNGVLLKTGNGLNGSGNDLKAVCRV